MSELAALLDDLSAYHRRYVSMTQEQADAVALFDAHTYVIDAAEQSPYFAISSAEMRSGKTTLQKTIELVAARPWRVVTPSEAVVYRKIARDRPTLLLDEYDAIFGDRDYEPLRALLNAGNEPGTTVPRCAGANRDQLEDYPIYCAKVMAGIGKLPATVADRAIEIRLKRKKRDEPVERFRKREVLEVADPLQVSLASLMEHHVDKLAGARPHLPDELDDRAQDAWEPLLAIAELAGGDWPARARAAALALSGDRDTDPDSVGVLLLADCKQVFGTDTTRLFTADLIARLCELEESPWATWHKGNSISPRALAARLTNYDIRSKTIRVAEETAKGYTAEDFEDAWSRFLPPLDVSIRHSVTTRMDTGETPDSQTSQDPDVTDTKTAANPHEHSDVTDVTDRNPQVGAELDFGHLGTAPLDVLQAELVPVNRNGLHRMLDRRDIAHLARAGFALCGIPADELHDADGNAPQCMNCLRTSDGARADWGDATS